MTHVLVVRTDSDGDVLLAGPAIRAVARRARVTLLVSPAGEQAARLLPDVHEVVVWACPWSGYQPPAVDVPATLALVHDLAARQLDAALVLTSYHQSPLPMALLLRLAGIGRIAASSEDYPGSLLDLRHRFDPDDDRHEVERALTLARAAGYPPDPDDDQRLALRPLPPPTRRLGLPRQAFVAVHPGASVPARAPRPEQAARIVAALSAAGWPVVLTGGPRERALTRQVRRAAGVADGTVHDLGGRTTWAELAWVLRRAVCLVAGNTGPAHLAAAVATPVVSLFAPVVPAAQWRPWGVAHVVLGDQQETCRGSRARQCPLPGHPCLTGVPVRDVVAAVLDLTHSRSRPSTPRTIPREVVG